MRRLSYLCRLAHLRWVRRWRPDRWERLALSRLLGQAGLNERGVERAVREGFTYIAETYGSEAAQGVQ